MDVLLHNPTTWVGLAFLIFVALAAKPVGRALATMLDKRSERIKRELEEAVRLREEAQALLAEYQKKQQECMQEAERIIEGTKQDAKRMAQQAEEALKASLEKRLVLANEKIAQSEHKTLQDVQEHLVDIATSAARTIVQEHVASGGGDELVRLATADIERKLH